MDILYRLALATLGEPDFVIRPDGENTYLRRWWLRRERSKGSVYLHQILRDDDDRALHDHPWHNTSIVLHGVLREVFENGGTRLLKPGSFTPRVATDAHRLEVVKGPVWTLFITGPVLREWGFWCGERWVHWEDFTAGEKGEEIGRGCGEVDDRG